MLSSDIHLPHSGREYNQVLLSSLFSVMEYQETYFEVRTLFKVESVFQTVVCIIFFYCISLTTQYHFPNLQNPFRNFTASPSSVPSKCSRPLLPNLINPFAPSTVCPAHLRHVRLAVLLRIVSGAVAADSATWWFCWSSVDKEQ